VTKHSEKLIIAALLLLFFCVIAGLVLTAQRYEFSNHASFIEQCQVYLQTVVQDHSAMTSLLFALVYFIFAVCAGSFISSVVKTQKKYRSIQLKASPIPQKLSAVISSLDIPASTVWYLPTKKSIAVTIGILNPKIVVSSGLLQRLTIEELKAVLLHEKYHLSNHHGFLHVVATSILQSLSLFLPALIDTSKVISHHFETVSDRYAARNQGSFEHVYTALYKLKNTSSASFTSLGFATLVDRRINSFEDQNFVSIHYNQTRLILSAVSVCLWAAVIIFSPTSTARSYSPEKLLSECSGFQCSSECQAELEKEVQSRALLMPSLPLSTSILP
jgi:Zn-dependent protease with chaperone function